jgi:hypothetical protein
MREKEEARLARHATRAQKIDADTARIQFSPEVVRSFARLEALVHDSTHYAPDLLVNLQELASGKHYPVHMALNEMALITRETMKHVHATGDTRAEQALDDLISSVMNIGSDPKPVTVLASKARGR